MASVPNFSTLPHKPASRRKGVINPSRAYWNEFTMDHVVALCGEQTVPNGSEPLQYLNEGFISNMWRYNGIDSSKEVIETNKTTWKIWSTFDSTYRPQFTWTDIANFDFKKVRFSKAKTVFLDYKHGSPNLTSGGGWSMAHGYGPLRKIPLYKHLEQIQSSEEHWFVAVNFRLKGPRGHDLTMLWVDMINNVVKALPRVKCRYDHFIYQSVSEKGRKGGHYLTCWFGVNEPTDFRPGRYNVAPDGLVRSGGRYKNFVSEPTKRELASLVKAGWNNQDICKKLFIEPSRIGQYRAHCTMGTYS